MDRVLGEDRWMVFEGAGWSLRVRARPERVGDGPRVRSWTVTFADPRATLPDALAALNLPLESRAQHESRRLAFPDPDSGEVHSLTAAERDGQILSVTAFDEPPDWDDVSQPDGERPRS